MKPNRGTLVLVFGILGIIFCPIFAILAWVMGGADLREIAAGTMDPSGKDKTNVGKILGMVGVALWILGIIASIILTVIVGAAAGH